MTEYRLDMHMKMHTKENRYECIFCGNKYEHEHSLGVHLSNNHTNKKEVKPDIVFRKNNKK